MTMWVHKTYSDICPFCSVEMYTIQGWQILELTCYESYYTKWIIFDFIPFMQFVIEAETKGGDEGDIAVDDIKLNEGTCQKIISYSKLICEKEWYFLHCGLGMHYATTTTMQPPETIETYFLDCSGTEPQLFC